MNKHVLTSLVFGLIISLSSCSKKKEPTPAYAINQTSVSINYDKEHQFSVKLGDKVADAASFTWTSSDSTVGRINKTGLFQGKKIGTTSIKAEGNGTVLTSEVTITPYSTLFKEPLTDFGASMSIIKSKETRKLDQQGDDNLFYAGDNAKVRYVDYIFTNNKLTSAGAFFQVNTQVIEEMAKFYSERYIFLEEDEGFFIFAAGKHLIGIGQNELLGVFALYIEAPEAKTLKANSLNSYFTQKLREIELKNIKK